MIKQHLALLGHIAVDKVTGIGGVIDSVCFDLYGCVQATLKPNGADKDGAPKTGHWFDVKRLKITSKKPVMNPPDFDLPEKGPAEKPTR
jgi:hypothetical protein